MKTSIRPLKPSLSGDVPPIWCSLLGMFDGSSPKILSKSDMSRNVNVLFWNHPALTQVGTTGLTANEL